jgi:hypothetical protein
MVVGVRAQRKYHRIYAVVTGLSILNTFPAGFVPDYYVSGLNRYAFSGIFGIIIG